MSRITEVIRLQVINVYMEYNSDSDFHFRTVCNDVLSEKYPQILCFYISGYKDTSLSGCLWKKITLDIEKSRPEKRREKKKNLRNSI